MKFISKIVLFFLVFSVKSISVAQKSHIKSLELSGVVIPYTDEIQANYFQTCIKISLDSTSLVRVYRKQELILTDSLKTVYFSDLKAGNTYTFLIRREKVKLVINLPWWKTWRFVAMWVLLLMIFFLTREKIFLSNYSIRKNYEARISELEIETLQLQMNPHFISNTLNSIQNYIILNEKILAAEYLSKFSKLIRAFLNMSRSKFIDIATEVESLKIYCDLERLRFKDKFDYVFDLSGEVDLKTQIPTMILQPYVENAINHGLRTKQSQGNLIIRVKKVDSALEIRIIDDGIGRKRAKEKKTYESTTNSISIKITEERILLFERYGYDITSQYQNTDDSNVDCGTTVILKIKQI